MLAQLKDLDQQVQEAASSFPGEVAGIRYSIGYDWSGDPAVFFRILLSDTASRTENLSDVTARVRGRLSENFRAAHPDYTRYFYFRSQSEQDRMKDPEWP